MKTKSEIITEARRQKDEIVLYFNDVRHWNNSVRKPHEQPIEPDPDGEIAKIQRALDSFLENN